MKTATTRDVRNHFARVSRWIEEGEQVRVTKRGRLFALIIPPLISRLKVKSPDFAAMQKEVFGNTRKRMLSPRESSALRENMRGEQ